MSGFQKLMSSRPVVAVVYVGAVICLAVTLVAAGFAACLMPQSTEALADAYVDTTLSPFSHDELVKGAMATRDYSFFSHDEHALLATIYDMNKTISESDYRMVSNVLRPDFDAAADPASMSTEQLRAVLFTANVKYTLDEEAISHLDDVYRIATTAYPILVVIAVLAIGAIAHIVFYRGWRFAAWIFVIAGGTLIVVFAIVGVWAAIDFYGFFQVFHSLFFAGDSWLFPYDCLLICMLPEDLWMGLGAIWLVTTGVLSVASFIVGVVLRKKCGDTVGIHFGMTQKARRGEGQTA